MRKQVLNIGFIIDVDAPLFEIKKPKNMKTKCLRRSKSNFLWKSISLVLILILTLSLNSQATVSITAASGGTNISADKAANSVNPAGGAFTTLGNFTITRQNSSDFTSGTNVTFILSTPTGWVFNTGAAVTATRGGGVSVVSATVATNTITVTYTCTGSGSGTFITLSGIQVQATNGSPVPQSGNITRTGGTGTISGFATGAIAGSLSLQGGAIASLSINPISFQVINVAFPVTMYALDQFNNTATFSGTVNMSTNAGTISPTTATLAAGTVTTNFTLNTAGAVRTITATNTSPAATGTSNSFIVIPAQATTDMFRSKATGTWATAATWERSPDDVNWVTATTAPTATTSSEITVRSGHTVTIGATLSIDQTTIEAGGIVNLTTGTLTIANGTGTDLDVLGEITNTDATAIVTTGTIVFESGSEYHDNIAASSTIPTATWDVNSTCFIDNWSSTSNTKSNIAGQTFGNFTFDHSSGSSSSTLLPSGGTMTCSGNFTFNAGSGRPIAFAGSGSGIATLDIAGDFILTAGTFTLNGGSTGAVNLNVAGDFTKSGTFTSGTSTVTFDGTTQSILGSSATAFSTLTIANGSTTTGTTAPTATVFNINGGGKYIQTSGTAIPGTTRNFAATSTYEYQTTAQTSWPTVAVTWGNLIINVSGSTTNLSAGGNISSVLGDLYIKNAGTGSYRLASTTSPTVNVSGDLIIDAGILNFSSGTGVPIINIAGDVILNGGTLQPYTSTGIPTFNVSGNWTKNAGTFTPSSGTVTFNSSAAQTIAGTTSTTFYNLTNTNTSATGLSIGINTTVSNILALNSASNGKITTGSNLLIVSNTSTSAITGASTVKYINGNLQRGILAGANTYSYPIGSASAYAPVTLAFTTGTVAGTLTGHTVDGDHANINSSTINGMTSVNRFWNFTINSGLTTANYGATFNWVSGDQDASYDYNSAICGKYNGATWAYPTIGTRTATSAQITGVSGFSDFQIGNTCTNPTITFGGNPSVCKGITSANLSYSATSGTPNQYSIVWSAAALSANFTNVTNATLPATPIILVVPGTAAAATYTGNLSVRNSTTGCTSTDYAISVTVIALPVISFDPLTDACVGTSAITLTATPTGGIYSGNSYLSGNTFNPSTVGNYNITYNVTVGGCPAEPVTQPIVVKICTPTWTGSLNNDYHNAANWAGGISVPGSSDDVIIPSGCTRYPILDAGEILHCRNMEIGSEIKSQLVLPVMGISGEFIVDGNLTIRPNASVVVYAGGSVTINGNLINSGSLVFENASSLITNGTVTGTATVKRCITGDMAWHFLSSPVASQSICNSVFAPSSFPFTGCNWDFYKWNPYCNTPVPDPLGWRNLRDGNGLLNTEDFGTNPVFEVTRGYLVAYENCFTECKSFVGTPNTGTKDVAFSDLFYDCWWLAGNPYPSAIDWSLVTHKDNLLSTYYYVWNENTLGYEYWKDSLHASSDAVNGNIPAMQGFFIKGDAAGTKYITIPNEARVHDVATDTWLKDTPANNKLEITLSNGTYSDKTFVMFENNSNVGKDWNDAEKMFSMSTQVPQVFTFVNNDMKTALNSMPYVNSGAIPVGIIAPAEGNLTMRVEGIESFGSSITGLSLEDLKLNYTQNLLQNPVYHFTAAGTEDDNRFLLHFAGPIGISDKNNSAINIYVNEMTVFITCTAGFHNSKVTLCNLLGQEILTQKLIDQPTNQVKVNAPKGYYIVKVQNESTVKTSKVYVN
jgi:hypothetical protein